jgi:hypothetical protein
MAESLGPRRDNNLRLARQEIEDALAGRRDREEILACFQVLGDQTVGVQA